MGIEGFVLFVGGLLAVGVVVWGGMTKHHSIGIAFIALTVAIVAAGCAAYAFVESHSLPWTIGYGAASILASAVGIKHLIGKWRKKSSLSSES